MTDKVQQQPHTFLRVLEWEAHMAGSVAAVTTVVDRHKVCRVGYGSARAPGGGRMRRQEDSPLSRPTVVIGVIRILLPQHLALGRNEPPPLAPE